MITAQLTDLIEHGNKTIENSPDDGFLYLSKGQTHIYLGEIEKAIETFQDGLVKDRTHKKGKPIIMELWMGIGVSSLYLERFEDALRAFDEIIQINPSYVNAWLNKALVSRKVGKSHLEKEYLSKAAQLNPQSVNNYKLRYTQN